MRLTPIRSAAKAVVLRDGQLLLTRIFDSRDPEGDWYLLPGGGQEPGETLIEALVREVREETGYHVEVHELLWVREYIGVHHEFAEYDHGHQIEFMFRCTVKSAPHSSTPSAPDVYQTGAEWVPLSGLPAIRLYPQTLKGPLASLRSGQAPGSPVYLGDVN